MRCGTRALSLISLGFGLVATGALSLAVATDYWLFTVEQVALRCTAQPHRVLLLHVTRSAYGPITIAIRARFEYDSSAIGLQHPTMSYVLSSNNEHVNSFALL